ncbi:MAG: type II toxin-antitoxin system HicB family antitoxin [Chloroflexi bacterium]|nr:type II toxin-antitoxin system HicB family antitoxin [Chloroflexota bacterium]
MTSPLFSFTGIIVQDDQDHYSALCPELDIASWGPTLETAKSALLEAATLHLEGAFEDGLPYLRPIPPEDDPRQTADAVVEVFRL